MPSGSVTPAGGAAFNGGTITEGLTIADPDGTEDQLTITGTGTGGAKLVNAAAVHTTFTVDSDGTAVLSSDDGMTLNVVESAGNDAVLSVRSTTQEAIARASDGFTARGGSLVVVAPGGGTKLTNLGQSAFIFHYNAAPADGALVAGDCALWFDSTNGAAKLMVKGKSADGTVVAAAIALS